MPTLPVVGAILAGKYRIVRVIGSGGMGIVFEAIHVRIGQRVAVKMLHPRTLETADLVTRFEREARAAGQLRSPNTARVTDVDITEDGLPYLVMEYLDGNDLAEELDRRGALPIAEAVAYVLQAASAMTEAHARGIVHRDLKPSNLFLAREGDRTLLKVLDFGISKVAPLGDEEGSVTSTLASMGTPLYMPPEQVRSAKNVDARSDVWSLGVILFELLSGQAPFLGGSLMAVSAAIIADPPPSLRELRPEVPAKLEQVVLKALEKVPAARWESMTALAKALLPFADSGAGMPFRSPGPSVTSSRLSASSSPGPADAVTPVLQTDPMRSKAGPSAAARRAWAIGLAVVPILGLLAYGLTRRHDVTPSSEPPRTPSHEPAATRAPERLPEPTPTPMPASASSAPSRPRPHPPASAPLPTKPAGPAERSSDQPASNPIRL